MEPGLTLMERAARVSPSLLKSYADEYLELTGDDDKALALLRCAGERGAHLSASRLADVFTRGAHSDKVKALTWSSIAEEEVGRGSVARQQLEKDIARIRRSLSDQEREEARRLEAKILEERARHALADRDDADWTCGNELGHPP
jgi:hypothetical protein